MEWPDEDVKFIIDETLDFSQFSDGQEEEEEEEVSGTCPPQPGARCAAQSSDRNILWGRNQDATLVWSPLSPEKLEEVRREANKLAALMEGCGLQEKENSSSETRLEMFPDLEPLPSIESLLTVRKDSRPPKRTYEVRNSPLKDLLPTVGPESHTCVGSPKASFLEMGSPTSCAAEPPVPQRCQNILNVCSPDNQLPKKSRPNQPLEPLAAVKSLDIKKTTTKCSRKERSTPPPLPKQNKKPMPSLRPPLQTNRKGPWRETEKSSGKASSSEGSQPGLQNPPSKGKKPVPCAKARPGPRLDLLKTGPVKASAAPQKSARHQKANACQATSIGSSAPQLQASYKPRSNCREVRTKKIAISGGASKLPVLNSDEPAFQQAAPSGTSQSSRLRQTKKATSGKSRLAANGFGAG